SRVAGDPAILDLDSPRPIFPTKSPSDGGVLAGTSSVERVDATLGEVPSGSCGAYNEGDVVRVPYDATYRFYRERQTEPSLTPGGAAAISFAATTAGVATGVWVARSNTNGPGGGLVLAGASLIILPSLGRAIGGDGAGPAFTSRPGCRDLGGGTSLS